MVDVTCRLNFINLSLTRPVLFIIIYVASATAVEQSLLFSEESCFSNITTTASTNILFPIHQLKNTSYERVYWHPPHSKGVFKNSLRTLRKRAFETGDRLRCGDPFFPYSDSMETWINVIIHAILGFIFGATSTLAIGFLSAMWWYTTHMTTQKAKNEERTQRLEELTYRNQQGCVEIEQSPMCPICLEDFPDLAELVDWPDQEPITKTECCTKEHEIRVLLCGHKYHEDCIGEWLERNDTCPICRLDHPVPSTPTHWFWVNVSKMKWRSCWYYMTKRDRVELVGLFTKYVTLVFV